MHIPKNNSRKVENKIPNKKLTMLYPKFDSSSNYNISKSCILFQKYYLSSSTYLQKNFLPFQTIQFCAVFSELILSQTNVDFDRKGSKKKFPRHPILSNRHIYKRKKHKEICMFNPNPVLHVHRGKALC